MGETKRRLCSRIKEHGRPSCKTAISEHILTCPVYKNSIDENLGDQLNPSSESHFQIIHQNLNRYNQRKTFEAITIEMLKPKLNEQVKSRKVKLI